jgi:hypothetical protein
VDGWQRAALPWLVRAYVLIAGGGLVYLLYRWKGI